MHALLHKETREVHFSQEVDHRTHILQTIVRIRQWCCRSRPSRPSNTIPTQMHWGRTNAL